MEKLYLKIKMNQYSKIIPKWGKNIYGLWSCEFLEYNDPEMEKIVEPLRSDPKKVSMKQMFAFRKLNKIACMDCKYYISRQCPFSKEEIEQAAKKYKDLKPKCSGCDFPITFHQFFLQNSHHEKLCLNCKEAKINGTFKEKKKKQGLNKMEICEGIIMIFALSFTFMEVLLDGVFDWGDFIFIGFVSLIPIGYIIYKIIKRRRKKKIEEEY